MKATLTARLAKVEKGKAGRPAIVWVREGRLAEAMAEAARLEAEGRRVLLVGWLA